MPERSEEKSGGSWKPLAAAVVAVLLLLGLQSLGSGIAGSGVVTEETREVTGFQGVAVSGSIRVELSEGDFAVKLRGDDNVLPLITTAVESQVLRIESEESFSSTAGVTAYISLPELHALHLEGSAEIVGQTLFQGEELKIANSGSGKLILQAQFERLRANSSGSGDIELTGSVGEQEISLSGSSEYRAGELECRGDTTVNLTGSGDCTVQVGGALNVQVAGSGNVLYRGEPSSVNSNVSGSGSISKL